MILCVLLLFLPQLLLGTNEGYYRALFGTSDFAMFTQQNCSRFIETHVGIVENHCPIGLSQTHDLDINHCENMNVFAETVRSHLIRDIHRKQKPRVLFVYVNNKTKRINYGFETLSLAGNHSHWTVPKALKEEMQPGDYQMQYGETLEDSIFDTESNILYLIIKSQHQRKLHIAYASNIYGINGRPSLKKLSEREFTLHKNNINRSSWIENPYENTVYYMEKDKKEPGRNIIYKLKMQEVLSSLVDGTEGENVSHTVHHSLIWAHNGNIIVLGRMDDVQSLKDSYFLRNTSLPTTLAKRCTIPLPDSSHGRTMRRVITLFDWDYCVLAYGGDGTKGPDGLPCPIYSNNQTLVVTPTSTGNTFLIVLLVLLGMMTLVLFVYVCWLRRNLDDSISRDERKPVPYYPSGQPLDSTFDMSVDRWDQY